MASLEDVLNGTAEPEILQEPAPVEPEPKGEEPATPPVAETPKEPDPQMVPVAALQSERQKRQQLERELSSLRSQQEPKKQEDIDADFFADPTAVVEHRVKMAEFKMSEQIARVAHPDYDEKLNAFASLAEENPLLKQQIMQHPHPAEFAYQTAVKHEKFQSMQDPTKFEADLTAKIEAKLRAEFEQKFKGASLPPDLAAVRSAGANNAAPSWGGPPPLEDIFKR